MALMGESPLGKVKGGEGAGLRETKRQVCSERNNRHWKHREAIITLTS